ncbi:unnamed protein product [Boreogadus saida]
MRANRGCLSTPTAVQTLPEPQEEPPREGPARPEAGGDPHTTTKRNQRATPRPPPNRPHTNICEAAPSGRLPAPHWPFSLCPVYTHVHTALCSAPTLELGTPQEQLQRGFQCKCSGHALQAPSPPAPQPSSPPAPPAV